MKTNHPKQPDEPEAGAHFTNIECPPPLFSKTGEIYSHPTLHHETRLRRLQLKGQSIPEGAVYVGRNRSLGGGLITDGIHWGNPFTIPWKIAKRAKAYRGLEVSGTKEYWALKSYFHAVTRDFADALMTDFLLQDRIKRELRGKNLICHCHPDLCCHGNILLKVANAEGPVYCVEIFNFIGYETLPSIASPALKEAFAYGLRLRGQGLPYRPGFEWPARR
jgi:hypothetical protein